MRSSELLAKIGIWSVRVALVLGLLFTIGYFSSPVPIESGYPRLRSLRTNSTELVMSTLEYFLLKIDWDYFGAGHQLFAWIYFGVMTLMLMVFRISIGLFSRLLRRDV